MKKLEWRQLMDYYLRGQITSHEFSWRVFTTLNKDNIRDFMDNAVISCVDLMMERLKQEPTTDEEWDKMLITGMDEKSMKVTLKQARKGVESVRDYLNDLHKKG